MKRYIEIIFDNSGSMNSFINNKPKHIIAKSIFKDTIIPKLDLKNDYVVLRTLSSGCNNSLSEAKRLDNDKLEIINTIDSISCYGSTPLYYTIKDSIVACEKSGTHESHIFILTDGDDTCYVNPESILGDNFLKIKAQLNINTILVQFAIESDISKNNLTSLSQKIGAKNVILSSNEIVDFDIIDKKISKVFIQTGLDKKGKFPHCKSEDLNEFYQLEQCSEYDYYLVELLYEEKLLKWKPSLKKWIDSNQKMELDFLYNLRFRNCIPESQVKQMLSQLQKPYYYSFECIYWDFKKRVWKYFPEIPVLNTLPNPDALLADKIEADMNYNIKISENYNEGDYYQVDLLEMNENYKAIYNLVKYKYDIIKEPIYLKEGDIIRFRNK